VARVAPSPKVVEVEPKVGAHRYRDLMVGVQMLLALAEPFPKFGQHLLHWRRTQLELPEVFYNVRRPRAVNASPPITDEAKNTKSPMLGIVTAGCRTSTLFIFLAGYGSLVFRAVSAFAERSASGLTTRAKRKVHGNCPAWWRRLTWASAGKTTLSKR
jgi:hypothetical protein